VSADVAVVGGGPAGLAIATALARRGRSVVVFERRPKAIVKAGETFGPRLRPLLEALGAWEKFAALATVPFRGIRSAWGVEEISDRPSVVHPLGEGWHVDRGRFEEMLGAVAADAGADLRFGAGACTGSRSKEGFRVLAQDGAELLHARYLVDASGRGAPATAQMEPARTWLSIDRQVAVVLRAPLPDASGMELELLLESSEDGWWYSVPQPDGTLVCALLTDADLVPAGARDELAARASVALLRTVHTARLAQAADGFGPPVIARADTGFLLPATGPGWCALGDAALGGDPLAGDGIERALDGALRAVVAIERELDGGPHAPSPPPVERIEAYLSSRSRYYAAERRWPEALYWRRRQPPDFQRQPLWLAPVQQLRRGPREWNAAGLARIEALAPRRAVAAALESLRTPQPAHAVLTALRASAPLDDRRLLVALQLLVEGGLAMAA
jgi:flavin-dependent dehydrogenase